MRSCTCAPRATSPSPRATRSGGTRASSRPSSTSETGPGNHGRLPCLHPELRSVTWQGKFKPDLPPRYDGTADHAEFLQLYELSIEAANGDEKVMANWFPMALKDGART